MNSKPSLNILINGWYGQLNAGDDAILEVFAEQMAARFDTHITVLSEMPENIPGTPRMRGVFHPVLLGRGMLSQIANGNAWRHLREIRKADLVVVGGGGILRDNTNWRNLLRLLDEIWLARLFGRKTMLYAIGVGPFKSRLGKWAIAATVRRCDLVTVRSERCAELLREIGVDSDRIHVVADPAFLLAPQAPADQELTTLFSSGKRKVGFYPTFFIRRYPDCYARFAAALDHLVETENVEVVAVPMSILNGPGEDDVTTARRVRAAMKHPEALHLYEKQLSASELKWATGQALFNITVRLHAMIFSLGNNVPAVPVNYEPKVPNVFRDFDAPEYLVALDEHLGTRLAETARSCLHNLAAYTEQIRDRRARVTARSVRTFDLAQEMFNNTAQDTSRAKRQNG